MPTIYRIIREDSEPAEQLPKGAAGAVLIDPESAGELVSGHLALYKESRMIVIRHPIEDSDLRASGETYESAKSKGILFFVEPNLCRSCGATVDVPHLRYDLPGGCLGPLFIGVGIGFWLIAGSVVRLKDGVALGILGALVAAAVWSLISSIAKRKKFRDLISQFERAPCPHCGSGDRCSVDRIGRSGLTLKNGRIVRVVMAGKS